MSFRMLIGSDIAGEQLKDVLKADLLADPRVTSVVDVGIQNSDSEEGITDGCSYPAVGFRAGQMIIDGEADRAILICGTGIGVAIAANKVPGIRATVAHDSFSLERSILSNDCQVVTFGQRVIGVELARRLAREWLGYVFDPTSHSQANVDLLVEYENRS